VQGKERIDLHVDPPPDLVIEIDITHPSIDKLPIYAQIQVPEVWRYDGERLEILVLRGDEYTATPRSQVLPAVTAEALTTLLPASIGVGDIAWIQRARAWTRTLTTAQ
jgi:Uma2 family endonuclease